MNNLLLIVRVADAYILPHNELAAAAGCSAYGRTRVLAAIGSFFLYAACTTHIQMFCCSINNFSGTRCIFLPKNSKTHCFDILPPTSHNIKHVP